MSANRECSTVRLPALRLVPLALALALAACGRGGNDQNAAQPQGQVIAKVGEVSVTIHELQNEYRHLRLTQDRITPEVTRQVLGELTKRKALAARAQAAKLDREPTVLLDIMRSREQLLATTLIQRDLQTRFAGIGKAETDRYINANPAQFSRRIRFDIERLAMPTAAETPEFVEAVKNASSIDEIERVALAGKIQYTRGASAVFSNDVPPELLTRIGQRKESDVFALKNPQTILYFKVRGEAPDPLTGENATRYAQLILRQQMTQAELTKKADGGDQPIVYIGEYEKLMATPAASAAPAPTGAPAASGAPAQPQAPAAKSN